MESSEIRFREMHMRGNGSRIPGFYPEIFDRVVQSTRLGGHVFTIIANVVQPYYI